MKNPRRPRSRSSAARQAATGRSRISRRHRRKQIGLVLGTFLIALAVSAFIWSENRGSDTLEAASQGVDVRGDVVYVNNRLCAMSDSPIAEKDLGRFESRVVYDGPIEDFKGKTFVFNQCCANCIESFPKKWAEERDEIMRKFGLAPSALK